MAAPEYAPGLFDCRFRRLGRAGYGRIGLNGQEGVLFFCGRLTNVRERYIMNFNDQLSSTSRQIGICRGKPGRRTTLSFKNQRAGFSGNLHRIPCGLSSYRLSFLCRFPEFIHEKWYVDPGDCHASVRYFIVMTKNSIPRPPVRQIPICVLAE